MAGNTTLETTPRMLESKDPFEKALGPTVIIARPTIIDEPPLPPLSEQNLPIITTGEGMRQFLITTCKFQDLHTNILENQLPVISDEHLQSLGITENKMEMLKNSLIGLKRFFLTPTVIDGWRDDYNARVQSIELLEKKYGDLFKNIFDPRNKLRINMLTEASVNIQIIARALRGNIATDSLREALESISYELKNKVEGNETEGKRYDQMKKSVPYMEQPLSEKLKIVNFFDTKVIQAINLLAGLSEEIAEEPELIAA